MVLRVDKSKGYIDLSKRYCPRMLLLQQLYIFEISTLSVSHVNTPRALCDEDHHVLSIILLCLLHFAVPNVNRIKVALLSLLHCLCSSSVVVLCSELRKCSSAVQ
jgi:hypothetical protein